MDDDKEVLQIMEQFLKLVSGQLDEYTTEKGRVVTGKGEVTLFTPAHVQFAKYGRGPGKMPPVEPLIDWVKQKGIASEAKEAASVAFAIAKSISKNGTKNYVPNAPNAIEEAIDNQFDKYTTRLSGYFADEINNKVLDLIVGAIPDNFKTTVKASK